MYTGPSNGLSYKASADWQTNCVYTSITVVLTKHKIYTESKVLGPVVQSIISIAKSLVKDSSHKIKCLNIFCRKNVRRPQVFLAKNGSVFACNTFEILTPY